MSTAITLRLSATETVLINGQHIISMHLEERSREEIDVTLTIAGWNNDLCFTVTESTWRELYREVCKSMAGRDSAHYFCVKA